MANVTSTREEVVLNFGVNQSWDQPSDTGAAREVDIQHRVILSPFAAKRLSDALSQLVRDYEQRYGPLGCGADRRGGRRVRFRYPTSGGGVTRGGREGSVEGRSVSGREHSGGA